MRVFLFWGIICSPSTLSSQPAAITPLVIEELLYRTEGELLSEELNELYEDSRNYRLNLNHSSKEQLEESGLFTPFQIHQLLKYRKRFGAYYSIYELAVLPGFNVSKLNVLQAYLDFNTENETQVTRRPKFLLMYDMYQFHPLSKAYLPNPVEKGEKAYVGSPLQTILRVRYQAGDHLSMGLTYEKDAGEKVLYMDKPQFMSGYLVYRGKRVLRQLVAGTYQLHHGLGLVNGTGFFHHPESLNINFRTLTQLKPYASKTEQRYERGAACLLGWTSMQLLLWVSYMHHDLSPGPLSGEQEEISWWDHQRNTGLYRTQSEIDGRDLASRYSTGMQLLWRHQEFALGIMAGAGRMAINKSGIATLVNSYKPVIQQTISMHGTWLIGQYNFFGELAFETPSCFALQLGTKVRFNDFMQGTLLLFHYGKGYQGFHPSSYPSGKQLENEQGLAIHLHLEPGRLLVAKLSGEIFQYPSPRYRSLVPTQAYKLGLTLQNPGTNPLAWRIRLISKIWQSTVDAGASGIRPLLESSLSRVDLRLMHKVNQSVSWQSRLVLSLLRDTEKREPAYAFSHEAKIRITPKLMGNIQFVIFHVKDWENRIYLHEPGFYYSFCFPSFYGSGQKTTLLLTWKAFNRISLSVKISEIHYRNKDAIGSGNDVVKGNKRWETGLQLRLNI